MHVPYDHLRVGAKVARVDNNLTTTQLGSIWKQHTACPRQFAVDTVSHPPSCNLHLILVSVRQKWRGWAGVV